jgi:hypothetical protein
MDLATTGRCVLALSFDCDRLGLVSLKGRTKRAKGARSLHVHSFARFGRSMQLRLDCRDNSLRLRQS